MSIGDDWSQKSIAGQKQLSRIQEKIHRFHCLEEVLKESTQLYGSFNANLSPELARAEKDQELISEISPEVENLQTRLGEFYLESLMDHPDDASDCFIEIHAAAGGHEACDFVSILVNMYQSWALRGSLKCEVVESTSGEVAGYRSVLLDVSGEFAHGWLKHESGAHRFVRVSKYDSLGRRHTSFASVNVFPKVAEGGGITEIPAGEIKIETMRSQGAGGQSVNTTDSAVRITHIPTKISAFCQNERCQHRNKAAAMQVLLSRLNEREEKKRKEARAQSHSDLPETAWGLQIRSYTLQPYQLIKDLRTGLERKDVDAVLDGDINEFLEASLVHSTEK